MKSEVLPLVQIEAGTLEGLLKEVKETLAPAAILPARKKDTFSTADMWKIRKRMVPAGSRIKKPVLFCIRSF